MNRSKFMCNMSVCNTKFCLFVHVVRARANVKAGKLLKQIYR